MEDIKERIKQHEGFRLSIYSDSLGFATIGYGHLVLDTDNFVEGVEYSKEELDAVFDKDFEIAWFGFFGGDLGFWVSTLQSRSAKSKS